METENKYKYTRAYHKIKDLILNNPKEIVLTAIDSQSVNKERERKIKMKEYIANKELIQKWTELAHKYGHILGDNV